MQRLWIVLGSLGGLTAVVMAALAAHGLSAIGSERLGMVRSGVEMHGWHALALLACGLWAPRGGQLADWAGVAFAAGLILFCGAVYALGLFAVSLGPLAPAGGITLMAGWVLLGLSAIRTRRH